MKHGRLTAVKEMVHFQRRSRKIKQLGSTGTFKEKKIDSEKFLRNLRSEPLMKFLGEFYPEVAHGIPSELSLEIHRAISQKSPFNIP